MHTHNAHCNLGLPLRIINESSRKEELSRWMWPEYNDWGAVWRHTSKTNSHCNSANACTHAHWCLLKLNPNLCLDDIFQSLDLETPFIWLPMLWYRSNPPYSQCMHNNQHLSQKSKGYEKNVVTNIANNGSCGWLLTKLLVRMEVATHAKSDFWKTTIRKFTNYISRRMLSILG